MHQSLDRYSAPVSFVHAPSWADFITTMVRQEKPDASSGRNSRLGKGNEPPHRESSLGLMEATTWVKRRHERRAGRNASEAIEPRDDSKPQADRAVVAGRPYEVTARGESGRRLPRALRGQDRVND